MPGINTPGSAYLGQYDAGGPNAYTLSAGVGSFVLSGQTASLLAGRLLAAGAGSFLLSGVSVGPVLVHGTAKDENGVALAGALVEMYRADTDVFVYETLSRADGTFTIYAPTSLLAVLVWMRAWRGDTPQIAGTSCTETLEDMAA